MHIDHLKAFVQIVKSGTFTKASESLYIPQPTISIRIQQLEKELDCQLFHRHKRNISLTTAGVHFYNFACNTLNSLEQTQTALREMKQEKNLTLHFGIPYSFGHIIADLVPCISKKIPHLKFSFKQTISEPTIEALKNRTLDIGITYIETIDKDIVFELIDQQQIKAIVSPEHRFAHYDELELVAICSEPLIIFKGRTRIESTIQYYKLPYQLYIETDNIKIIKELVHQNQGITLMPEILLSEEIASGFIRAIPIKSNPFKEYKTYLAYASSNDDYSGILNETIMIIKEHFMLKRTQQEEKRKTSIPGAEKTDLFGTDYDLKRDGQFAQRHSS